MSTLLSAWVLLVLILSACSPSPPLSLPTVDTHATAEGGRGMSAKVKVELDIFSGNPNPTWVLSDADGVLFLKRLAMLPKASAKELSTNLGYRGFIVEVTNGTEKSLVRIQNGTFQLSQGDTNVYYSDPNRDLERWLLNSGKSFLKKDLFNIIEIEFPK
jgi:hypothetical protein